MLQRDDLQLPKPDTCDFHCQNEYTGQINCKISTQCTSPETSVKALRLPETFTPLYEGVASESRS